MKFLQSIIYRLEIRVSVSDRRHIFTTGRPAVILLNTRPKNITKINETLLRNEKLIENEDQKTLKEIGDIGQMKDLIEQNYSTGTMENGQRPLVDWSEQEIRTLMSVSSGG